LGTFGGISAANKKIVATFTSHNNGKIAGIIQNIKVYTLLHAL